MPLAMSCIGRTVSNELEPLSKFTLAMMGFNRLKGCDSSNDKRRLRPL
jgi:hypothetical protein